MLRTEGMIASRYYIESRTIGRQMAYVFVFNVLLVASSYIQFPLPFSPVPVTAQTMAVLACGLFLGPIRGMITILAYLAEGFMGLPVFAGGTAGIAKLMGPTGGYLIGFIAAVFVVGFVSDKVKAMTYSRLIIVLALGTITIFIPGLIVLSIYVPQGMVFQMGLYPFIPGAVIKLIITASALSAYKKIRNSI